MSNTRLIAFEMSFSNLMGNTPVVVRLTDGSAFSLEDDGFQLTPTGSPGSANIAGLVVGSDTVTITAANTCDLEMSIGVRVREGANSLSGHAIMGIGTSVTVSQVGNREQDEITSSRQFLVSVK